MNEYYQKLPLMYPDQVIENFDNRFIGNGWEISNENGKFYFLYVSGQLTGKENKIEISQDDFIGLQGGAITFDQICRKYRVN